MPFWMTEMMNAPISVPRIRPDPPARLVPPTTTAAITYSSYMVPMFGVPVLICEAWMQPPSPADKALTMYTNTMTNCHGHAGQPRGLLVAAHGVDVAPQARVGHEDMRGDVQHDQQNDGVGNAQRSPCPSQVKAGGTW